MSLVPPGRRECKLSKRAERARTEQTERKKKRRLESFYATKEKQVLRDEGIMAEKRERKMRGRATWSILSNLKVNHFSRIKAGFRIPTVCLCVLVCVCVSACACAPALVCVREQALLCVTSKHLTLICQTFIFDGVTSLGGV